MDSILTGLVPDKPDDHFKEDENGRYAGLHLLIDLRNVPFDILNDKESIRAALLKAVKKAGAKNLYTRLHPFSPQGVAGVAVLAESHMSIHTWPERGEAALDAFMCGKADPHVAYETFCAELGIDPLIGEVQAFRRLVERS